MRQSLDEQTKFVLPKTYEISASGIKTIEDVTKVISLLGITLTADPRNLTDDQKHLIEKGIFVEKGFPSGEEDV